MNRGKKTIQVLLLIVFVTIFLMIGFPIGVIIGYWNQLPSLDSLEYENRSWRYPTKVYSDIARIIPETSADNLVRRLVRLNYQRVNNRPQAKGQFYVSPDGNEISIFLRDLKYPRIGREGYLVFVKVNDGKISNIVNSQGLELNEFILEPELIDEFFGGEGIDREIVKLDEIPDMLKKAFIAIEDKRFYKHSGIDPYRIIGALIWDIRHWSKEQGASTITQQLARDLFLTRERLITRKIKECLLALKIEKRYTKDEILERYLNRVNLGRVGSREIYGVEQAARYYFGKHVWQLNLPECATLAGIPKWPPKYSPIRNPENAKERRKIVLKEMLEMKYITPQEYKSAVDAPLITSERGRETWSKDVAYFVDYVRSELEKRYEPNMIYGQGLSVYTTLDMSIQLAANMAVQKHLRILDRALGFPDYELNKPKWFANPNDKEVKSPESYLQAALVCIQPSTGYIRAMVGGRDYSVNQYNRAFQAQRQPGSAFKPFVYCAAFAHKLATPMDIILDESWSVITPDGKRWSPKNIDGKFHGPITVRHALTRSINVATARFMWERAGVDRTINIAKRMGIKSPLARVPSLALGSSDVNVLEITSAYGVWANQGLRAEPICIKYIIDREENILEENLPSIKRVLEKNVSYVMTNILRGVLDGGTGSRARAYGFKRPAAGKTGTTDDYTDAWFIGFTPDLVAGVWVGFDDRRTIRRTGSEAAVPIWAEFMKLAVDGPVRDFNVPKGVVFTEATDTKGRTYTEAILPGTHPKTYESLEEREEEH